ncbi:DUF305 domain-containing protein [Deinococcus sp.]|uniref:DUF305 domain-containing protein n=1 Tax=Deinococcus sp. TaxID=47478 RepID=UPI0025B8D724|nr:DUF305 domain-containing protein [Deinococcus sp.]
MMKRVFVLVALLGGLALAGGRESGPVMPMNHAGHTVQSQMTDMLTPLRPLRGKAFDIKWTQLMIDHHQMAVMMAQHELAMGQNSRVKAAAQKVIDAQMSEIATMQGWLQSWTGQLDQPRPMPMQMDMPGGADKWFLEGMIPHHQGAIDMARLIPSRTQNADLRRLGMDIIRVQSNEIAQYRQLLKVLK